MREKAKASKPKGGKLRKLHLEAERTNDDVLSKFRNERCVAVKK